VSADASRGITIIVELRIRLDAALPSKDPMLYQCCTAKVVLAAHFGSLC
jgi:hypothetical protein